MSELAVQYVVNPFKYAWEVFSHAMYMHGMARAARELQRMGYYEESNRIFQQMRSSVNK